MTDKDTQAEQSPKNAGVGPAKADHDEFVMCCDICFVEEVDIVCIECGREVCSRCAVQSVLDEYRCKKCL